VKYQLTEREQEAVTWARSNYHAWRKRFGETLEQHMAAMPTHMVLPSYYPEESRQAKRDLWEYWYHSPFGAPDFNEHVAIVRRLLLSKLI
jgi:hypothetical protein